MIVEPAPLLDAADDPLPAVQPRRVLTEGRVVFAVGTVVYLALAAVLVFQYDSVLGDAMSRVANASYMLYSRDPKLASVGFVWTPLPSLVLVPFLPLKAVWPALVTRGFLANIESALLMAGSAALLRGVLADLGLARLPRLTLVVVFILNPMSLYYGANGMSEAMLLFFLLAAVRPLARWMRQPTPLHLVVAGVALGLGYLGRYEAIAAGFAATALVAAVSYRRGRQDGRGPRDARDLAISDGLLIGVPVVFAFVLWAVASWLIVGHPFDTFTSRYGNTAQVSASRAGIIGAVGGTGADVMPYVGRQLLALAPAFGFVLLAGIVVAWRRRDPWITVPITVLGAVMVSQALTVATGGSFGWLRFQICAIPLTALLVGYLLAPAWGRSPLRAKVAPTVSRRRVGSVGAAVLAVLLTGAGTITALIAWTDPVLAREEHAHVVPIADRVLGVHPWDQITLGDLAGERDVAAAVDALAPGEGTVLVDVALGFPIVLASSHPRQFVITPDRDFPDAVTDPVGTGIRYILISRDTGTMDAVAAEYPDLYASGSGFSRLVREFPSPHGNGRTWRLYRVFRATPPGSGGNP